MTDAEFEQELERRFDRLFREHGEAWKSKKEAERRESELQAKMNGIAQILWGDQASAFISGYPRNGKPEFDKETR